MHAGMENYMMYMGADGVYTHTNSYERDESCLICSAGVPVQASDSMTLQEVCEHSVSPAALCQVLLG
jgi:NEDD8-activating enzyme E1